MCPVSRTSCKMYVDIFLPSQLSLAGDTAIPTCAKCKASNEQCIRNPPGSGRKFRHWLQSHRTFAICYEENPSQTSRSVKRMEGLAGTNFGNTCKFPGLCFDPQWSFWTRRALRQSHSLRDKRILAWQANQSLLNKVSKKPFLFLQNHSALTR